MNSDENASIKKRYLNDIFVSKKMNYLENLEHDSVHCQDSNESD